LAEVAQHPHNVARGSFIEIDGKALPGPAPRFSVTPGRIGEQPKSVGEDTDDVLREWGVLADITAALMRL